MAETSEAVQILELCRIAPPTGTVAELSIPLTMYDLLWLDFHTLLGLFFYQFPHPMLHFVETIIPKLKESLSLTLKHFLPFAGNLIYHPNSSDMPQLRYVKGDGVSVTFAESSEDFQDLVGDHPRKACRFHSLVPQLRRGSLFAVQVTLFPNRGIAIGLANQHVLGDFSVFMRFITAWASINRFDGDEKLLNNDQSFLPFYNREVIKDPYKLDILLLDHMKKKERPWKSSSPMENLIRATYTLSQAAIKKLKNFVLEKNPNLVHVSSFVIACAYVWTCWLKALDETREEKVDENEKEWFLFAMDYRARLDPPVPANYFGNCVVPCIAKATHGELVGPQGILVAVEKIGMAIDKSLHDPEGILKGVWLSEAKDINWQRLLTVSGSPKQDNYGPDFGWGRPEKFESISTDTTGAMFINKSRKYEGDLVVSLSLQKNTMDSFATIFTAGLSRLPWEVSELKLVTQ